MLPAYLKMDPQPFIPRESERERETEREREREREPIRV